MFQVNPDAEVSKGFPTFRPGIYKMRIDAVVDRSADPNNPKQDFKVTLKFADPSQLYLVDGSPYNGTLDGAGSLFDYVMQAPDKQWKLRTLTEACGLPWQAYDPCTELVGKEVDVKVKLETYEGEVRNKADRYVIAE